MKIEIDIVLIQSEIDLLKDTNWESERPFIDPWLRIDADRLIRMGVLMEWSDGSIHLTDYGKRVLDKIK